MKVDCYTEEIIDMYCSQNLNTVEIARIIGCSDSSVGKILKKNNIPRTHTPNEIRLTEEDIRNVCYRYSNNETTAEIAQTYNVCDTTIAKVLRQNGVQIRPAKRRSRIKNHSYFKTIDSVDKAYFLGWMISDGSVVECKTRTNRQKIISLEIHNKDRYILDLFADMINADKDTVKTFDKRNHVHIRFASDEMAEDLSKYGVIPNKTQAAYLPEIREDLMHHLLRGIFDGDGTITIDKNNCGHFAFYGTQLICSQIAEHLHREIGFRINKVSKSTCYHVWYGGRETIKTFAEYLYKDCDRFYLNRKYLKFLKIA